MKELKKEIWELIDSNTDNISDRIGWGSMDSLIDEIIELNKSIANENNVTITLKEYNALKRDSEDLNKVNFMS